MKHKNRPRLLSRAILLTTAAAAVAALLSCGDDDERSTYHAIIEKERWGLIENDCSKEAGINNSKALTLALKTLSEEGHIKLRLENGYYCVWGAYDEDSRAEYNVSVPSNVELDLNGATLRLVTNAQRRSRIIQIYSARNVKVFNGTLIGDRDTHIYGNLQGPRATFGQTNEWASHEFGIGVHVFWECDNIEIYNLTVKDVTGDCIYVGDRSTNVTIRNNKLSRARRDGIVSTSSDNLVIRDNDVFDIYNDVEHRDEATGEILGIGAEACIAFEANVTDGSHKISNAQIYNNRLDGTRGRWNHYIHFHYAVENVVVRNNDLAGNFYIQFGRNILFEGNTVRSGDIAASGPVNPDIPAANSENVIIRNNKFYNVKVNIFSTNMNDHYSGYRKNYALIGNEFIIVSNWRSLVSLGTTVNTAVIDNKFIVDKDNWDNLSYPTPAPHPNVGANPTAFHLIYIWQTQLPPQADVGYNFYFANNTAGKDSEYVYLKYYNVGEDGYGVRENVAPEHPVMPEWYSESNNRAEAVAWIDSWKWY